jgi:hypothetical protein
MKRKGNPKLVVNLVITLLLAAIVTGFGRPGFLLKYLQPKEPKLSASVQERPRTLTKIGNSAPFSIEPLPGFTISAEKDALDRDRTFTVSELAWEKLGELEDRLLGDGTPMLFFSGWELDAGLEDNERLPGTYKVGIDLKRLGIPEELYDILRVYRLDDAGNLIEYLSQVKNGVLFYESCQNSGALVGADLVVSVLRTFIELSSPEPETGFFEKDGTYWVRNPSDPSVKQYKIVYSKGDVKSLLNEQDKNIMEDAIGRARSEAIKKCGNGSTAAEKQAEMMQALWRIRDSEARVDTAFKSAYETSVKSAERVREQVAEIGTMCYEAHRYLATLGIRMPDAATCIYLKEELDSGTAAEMNSGFFGPYVDVGLDELKSNSKYNKDEMLLTLTHELFHVCQVRYNGKTHANFKFFEAMAQLLEEDAQRYYKTHYNVKGTDYVITTDHPLENGREWQYYTLPFNKRSVTYYNDLGSAYSWSVEWAKISNAGYPLARFMEYLNEVYGKKTYKEMLETHESVVSYVDVLGLDLSENLKTTWCLSDAELTESYLAFAKKYQTKFYNRQLSLVHDSKWRMVYPISGLGRDGSRHFKLIDHAYSIRINEILGNTLDIVSRVGHLLVPDEDFADQLSDMTLLPLGANQWTKCKYGIFFYPHLEGAIYIMEIDGGTNPNTSGVSGYTVYQLDPPRLEDVEVSEGLLSFTMPEKSKAAEDGKIDGYRVTITCSDGKKTVYYPKTNIAGQTVKIKTSRLNKGDHKDDEDPLSYSVTVCEYILDGNRYLFGPESNPDDMDSLLEEMGAVEGEITASIYWPSKDDLDLHCITPDGGHIYYSNKSAGGGQLDVDMQVQGDRDSGVENIYFASPSPGEYQFYINNYTDRTEGDVGCRIRIKVGNQILVDETVSMGGRSKTYKLTYGGQGKEQNVEVLEGN